MVGKGEKKAVSEEEWRKNPVESRLEYSLVKVHGVVPFRLRANSPTHQFAYDDTCVSFRLPRTHVRACVYRKTLVMQAA